MGHLSEMDSQAAVLYNWCWLEWSLEQIISGGLLDPKLFYSYSPAGMLQWQPVPGKKPSMPLGAHKEILHSREIPTGKKRKKKTSTWYKSDTNYIQHLLLFSFSKIFQVLKATRSSSAFTLKKIQLCCDWMWIRCWIGFCRMVTEWDRKSVV